MTGGYAWRGGCATGRCARCLRPVPLGAPPRPLPPGRLPSLPATIAGTDDSIRITLKNQAGSADSTHTSPGFRANHFAARSTRPGIAHAANVRQGISRSPRGRVGLLLSGPRPLSTRPRSCGRVVAPQSRHPNRRGIRRAAERNPYSIVPRAYPVNAAENPWNPSAPPDRHHPKAGAASGCSAPSPPPPPRARSGRGTSAMTGGRLASSSPRRPCGSRCWSSPTFSTSAWVSLSGPSSPADSSSSWPRPGFTSHSAGSRPPAPPIGSSSAGASCSAP